VIGVLNTQHVARILYQSMLESASRPDEGPFPFARKTDCA
jgi:hypothetical protein